MTGKPMDRNNSSIVPDTSSGPGEVLVKGLFFVIAFWVLLVIFYCLLEYRKSRKALRKARDDYEKEAQRPPPLPPKPKPKVDVKVEPEPEREKKLSSLQFRDELELAVRRRRETLERERLRTGTVNNHSNPVNNYSTPVNNHSNERPHPIISTRAEINPRAQASDIDPEAIEEAPLDETAV